MPNLAEALQNLITPQSLRDPKKLTLTIKSQIQTGRLPFANITADGMLDLLQARLEKCDSPEAILLLCHFMNEHFGEYIDARCEIKGVKNYRLDSSTTALCFVTYSIAEVLEADEMRKVLARKYRDEIDRMQAELEEKEEEETSVPADPEQPVCALSGER